MLITALDDFKQAESRGNQLKFYNDGYWYKLDSLNCYEGLAEAFVTWVEEYILDFPHVLYMTTTMSYSDNIHLGCYSYNMYNRMDISFVSLRSLLRRNNIPLNIFIKEQDTAKNVEVVVDTVFRLTGLNIFSYLSRLIMLDCIIQNEDRHIMNLGVCYCGSDNKFYEAPCFDNGASLFCVNWVYRKRKTLEENIKSARSVARPFSKFYDKQLEAVLRLGALPLIIRRQLLLDIEGYVNPLYPTEIVERVKQTFKYLLSYYEGKAFYYV